MYSGYLINIILYYSFVIIQPLFIEPNEVKGLWVDTKEDNYFPLRKMPWIPMG